MPVVQWSGVAVGIHGVANHHYQVIRACQAMACRAMVIQVIRACRAVGIHGVANHH